MQLLEDQLAALAASDANSVVSGELFPCVPAFVPSGMDACCFKEDACSMRHNQQPMVAAVDACPSSPLPHSLRISTMHHAGVGASYPNKPVRRLALSLPPSADQDACSSTTPADDRYVLERWLNDAEQRLRAGPASAPGPLSNKYLSTPDASLSCGDAPLPPPAFIILGLLG
jgi:hypothetical protein